MPHEIVTPKSGDGMTVQDMLDAFSRVPESERQQLVTIGVNGWYSLVSEVDICWSNPTGEDDDCNQCSTIGIGREFDPQGDI